MVNRQECSAASRHFGSDGVQAATDVLGDGAAATVSADIEIPFGQDASGRIWHISQVASGLACACVCPGCSEPLVAYKGKRKQHHFGHRGNGVCAGALETALHKFAKQVLSEKNTLMLPLLVARYGETEDVLKRPGEFRYDSVCVEPTKPNMRPDIIVRRGEAALLVEVAVTHPCEEAKLALIRERRLPAIEIDLSKVARGATEEEHTEAILWSAPRHWLFNKHIEQAENEFQRAEAERAAAEKARQERAWGKLVASLTEAYRSGIGAGHPGWLEAVKDAGLEAVVGVTIAGDGCFTVPPAVWQSAILRQFVLGPGHYNDFSPSEVLEWLAERGFLKAAFKEVKAAATSYLVTAVDAFRPPVNVVGEFMGRLAEKSVIYRGRTRWSASVQTAYDARSRRQLSQEARARVAALAELVGSIKESAHRGADIDFKAWLATRHDGLDETPERIALAGGLRFDEIKRRLSALQATLKPGGHPTTDSLLGLPLEVDQQARGREELERQESWRLAHEQRERAAAERRQVETRVFMLELRGTAKRLLGDEDGEAWLTKRFPEGAADNAALELPAERMSSLRWALEAERRRVVAEEDARFRAAETAERCVRQLRTEAAREPDLSTQERMDLWMTGTRRELGWASPVNYCVDQGTLDRCLGLLPSRLGKGSGKVRSRR